MVRIIGVDWNIVENNLDAYMQSYHQLALVCIVIASGLLGYFSFTFPPRPFDGIHDTVKEISADPTNRYVRVPTTNCNDEPGELITMFNETLDRMQRYIDQQSQFVSDVSHELRTPVAIIQGHLEMLQRWARMIRKCWMTQLKQTLIGDSPNEKTLVQCMRLYDNNFKMLYPTYFPFAVTI